MNLTLHKNFIFLATGACIFLACNNAKESKPLFERMEHTGIEFENKVQDTKDENSFVFRNYYNGGGVAIGDINNDGFADVFLTSNTGDNKLYLNGKNWTFTDITSKSGIRSDSLWSTGATMVDVNGDGWLDIYVCSSGNMHTGKRKNKLYINNHDLTFTEASREYGLDVSGYSTQAAFFDYDLDGDLDCFIINNSPIPYSSLNFSGMRDKPENEWTIDPKYKGGGNHLFRNDNGHFVEVTASAGIHTSMISYGLGISVGDLNNDGYPDIYVGNDFIERDYLYINQGNGTFKDELENKIEHLSMSSMSTDLADINNDGYPEIFTTDMFPETDYRLKTMGTFDNVDLYRSKQRAGFYHQFVKNCLQLNRGDGTFSDVANFSGVGATDWSWAGLLFDADNDGLNDVFVCNGINRDVGNLDFLDFFSNDVYRTMQETGKVDEVYELLKHIPVNPQANKIYRNKGDLSFDDATTSWGFSTPTFSNGAAYGDLDNDGDLDLVVNNENMPAFIYRNQSREQNKNNYLSISLKGTSLNQFAIGSKIRIYKGNQVFYREISPVRGFQSSVDYKTVIGLGKNTAVDSLTVTWPDGSVTLLNNPGLNKLYELNYATASRNDNFQRNDKAPLYQQWFEDVNTSFEKHKEDDYVDFYFERNIPELLSREGPHAAVADVNGDGLQDVYIGGASGQAGQLYLQEKSGRFQISDQRIFKEYSDFEDVAVVFLDVDGDGDQDLFIGSGGNNVTGPARQLQHRLYKNDGKGNFSIDVSAFGQNETNISVALSADFDHDGDADLFIGGRSIPQSYGATPPSYICLNDGKGHFTTQEMRLGMVTSATWADQQLFVAGEWMAPQILQWENGKMEPVPNSLSQLKGWWQSITVADLDGDGLKDIILGNIGENFYLRPSSNAPVKCWISDFDQNGTTDKLITRTIDGKDMPVFLKQDVQDQLPMIKKQNLKHGEFATRSIQDLFKSDLLNNAEVKTFNFASSIIAWNLGNGKYNVQPLPNMMQLSSINSIVCSDINGDGRMDIITGGNNFGFPPQFGRLDASYGDVLINQGRRNFSYSNLNLRGAVRDAQLLNSNSGENILFLINDEKPVMYRIKNYASK